MKSLGLGLVSDLEDAVSSEVGICWLRPSDQVSLVHDLHMLGMLVCLTVNTNGPDTHALGCLGYATGDLSSVRD